MKKIIGTYEITECTAIEPTSGEEVKALLVHDVADEFSNGDAVVFGVDMPEDLSDIRAMEEETFAWVTDSETLETVKIADR